MALYREDITSLAYSLWVKAGLCHDAVSNYSKSLLSNQMNTF